MSNYLPEAKTIGFHLADTLGGPVTVTEYGEDGSVLRVRKRVLKQGEVDPFSGDYTSDDGDDEERERLFWERTEDAE